ncbi:MAG: hypothetical protein LBL46_01310 [Rickettsiales bacterium]|jgi:hypothetical protein|nr:hypothetical protein [Rickettsiales bacterium]
MYFTKKDFAKEAARVAGRDFKKWLADVFVKPIARAKSTAKYFVEMAGWVRETEFFEANKSDLERIHAPIAAALASTADSWIAHTYYFWGMNNLQYARGLMTMPMEELRQKVAATADERNYPRPDFSAQHEAAVTALEIRIARAVLKAGRETA